MRIDERRVAEGKATLWGTMMGKGPKGSDEGLGIIVDGMCDSGDDIAKDVPQSRVDRDIENLVV